MDACVRGEFFLEGFSPQSLTFLPGLNRVLVASREGEVRCIDVLDGRVQQCLGIWQCSAWRVLLGIYTCSCCMYYVISPYLVHG